MFSISLLSSRLDVTEALVVILYSAELLREGEEKVESHLSTSPSQQIYQKLIIPSFARCEGSDGGRCKANSDFRNIK